MRVSIVPNLRFCQTAYLQSSPALHIGHRIKIAVVQFSNPFPIYPLLRIPSSIPGGLSSDLGGSPIRVVEVLSRVMIYLSLAFIHQLCFSLAAVAGPQEEPSYRPKH